MSVNRPDSIMLSQYGTSNTNSPVSDNNAATLCANATGLLAWLNTLLAMIADAVPCLFFITSENSIFESRYGNISQHVQVGELTQRNARQEASIAPDVVQIFRSDPFTWLRNSGFGANIASSVRIVGSW